MKIVQESSSEVGCMCDAVGHEWIYHVEGRPDLRGAIVSPMECTCDQDWQPGRFQWLWGYPMPNDNAVVGFTDTFAEAVLALRAAAIDHLVREEER